MLLFFVYLVNQLTFTQDTLLPKNNKRGIFLYEPKNKMKKLALLLILLSSISLYAQNAGEVMFVGFNADGNDGFAFVTLVPLVTGTTIYFTDDNWNGSPVGGAGAFNSDEGAITWTNNTGNTISAGIVISISDINGTLTISPNLGTASESNLGFNLGGTNETLYMFLGTDDNTPTTFLSAIANDDFGNSPVITGTGLTSGINAFESTTLADEDVMVYTGSIICSSVSACAAALSTEANWDTDDGGPNDHTDGDFPDFPADITSNFYGVSFDPVTYYSRNATSGGDWNDPNSWTTISDGSGAALAAGIYPASSDNVVILSGHTITIDAVTDNQNVGFSPNGLGRTNVGGFTGSGDLMFYQTGDILVANGGTLISTEEVMLEGYTLIAGTLNVIGEDVVNLGNMDIDEFATVSNVDDLILSGDSETIIDNISTIADDLYIDHTDASLCGKGVADLGNGGANPEIQFFNGGSLVQVCEDFTITCTDPACVGTFPASGTGSTIIGITGPGGVGNSLDNQLWLKADDLTLTDGASVTSWADASGNGLTATSSGVTTEEPTFNTNDVNSTLPSISFDGGDFLNLGTPASLNFIPGTDSWSFFLVYNVTGATPQGTFFSKATQGTRQYQYTIDDNAGSSRFTSFIGGNATTGSVVATNAWFVSSHTNNTTQKDSWTNGATNFSGAGVGTDQDASADVLIGARRGATPTTTGFLLIGDIAEIAMYDAEVNTAQRIIIDNSLAAKYVITISNDEYDMDDTGNGDFDFEVAGIGQATDGSNHRDAQGSGAVRVRNSNDLDNGEYLIWGHDNGVFTGTTSDVDGTVIEERLTRIWRFSETGDVGTVSLSFDLSSLASPLGSNLRLLIDRDGDGFTDNDVTPIVGSASGNIIVFSGVNLQDGDRITIGNTDASVALPIELLSFETKAQLGSVLINWTTASETNNNFFTIERSQNAQDWQSIKKIDGVGTSFEVNSYQQIDRNPFQGTSYYRLKQTDFDGEHSYSNVSAVNIFGENKLLVFPNPSTGIFKITNRKIDIDNVKLYNGLGQVINVKLSSEGTTTIIDASTIPAGVYILQINDGLSNQSVRLLKR